MPTTITERDRKSAELYLEGFLTESMPTGDFARGSYLRDLVITAMSYTVAHLRAEAAAAAERGSVKRIKAMASGIERDTAADDAMSSWFLSRKTGRPSRGVIVLHLTQKADVVIPAGTRFYYSPSLAFVPDYSDTIVIPASSVIEVTGAGGLIVARYALLSAVAIDVGTQYDVEPAVWTSWDRFSPYVSRVENVQPFVGGQGSETTDAFLARAADAVSNRTLDVPRGIRTVLKDKFSTVDDVVVIGAGDPEMNRDLVTANGVLKLHSGAYVDAYVRGPISTAPTFEGVVGGTFTDERPYVTALTTAVSLAAVTPGMILKIKNPATDSEVTEYIIESVRGSVIMVPGRTPFPDVRSGVQFSIGTTAPAFANVVASATGSFSRSVSSDHTIFLPSTPICRIRAVNYTTVSGSSPLSRVNYADLGSSTASYAIKYSDPHTAFTGYQSAQLVVSTDIANGTAVQVEYDTLVGFDQVHTYVTDPRNRNVCANVLPKALIPAYAKLTVHVQSLATVVPPTADEVKLAVMAYIDALPVSDGLHPRRLMAHLISLFDSRVAALSVPWSPSAAWVDLQAPTGDVVRYVMQYDELKDDAAILIAPEGEITYPAKVTLQSPVSVGVSTRTMRFLSAPDLIDVVYDG